MKDSNDFQNQFKQDGYLWEFGEGDVIPFPIRRLRTWTGLKFAGLTIAFLVFFAVGAIAFKIIIPGSELVLTQKYIYETGEIEKAYVGYHKPFLLSGTTILWCNGSLESFPSLGTVIRTNPDLQSVNDSVVDCR